MQSLQSTLKKAVHAAEQYRPDIAARRATWKAAMIGLDADHLVFIDETWAKTNMAGTRDRNRHGTPPIAKVS